MLLRICVKNDRPSQQMIFEFIKLNIDVDDDDFNSIYPQSVRINAKRHWTPVDVAKRASEFLAEKPGTRVLDIGSGPGKFCMVGAAFTKGFFTGVEQRLGLVEVSKRLSRIHHLQNVDFIHANITSIKFKDYDSFYFYNSFHENIDLTAKIDHTVIPSVELYTIYHKYVYQELSLAPLGTRIVTYWGTAKEIPSSYELLYTTNNGLLKFWKKTN